MFKDNISGKTDGWKYLIRFQPSDGTKILIPPAQLTADPEMRDYMEFYLQIGDKKVKANYAYDKQEKKWNSIFIYSLPDQDSARNFLGALISLGRSLKMKEIRTNEFDYKDHKELYDAAGFAAAKRDLRLCYVMEL